MRTQSESHYLDRRYTAIISLLAAIILLAMVASIFHTANAAPAVITATKSVDKTTVPLGDTVEYSIVINDSSASANFVVTDVLPAGFTYVPSSLSPTASGIGYIINSTSDTGNTIVVKGSVGTSPLTIKFKAIVTGSYTIGNVITNTAQILENGTITSTAQAPLSIISGTVGSTIYLPIIFKALPQPSVPTLTAINQTDAQDGIYTVSWSASTNATDYVLEEDDNAAFSSPATVYSGSSTSWTVPSGSARAADVYYYRVKAVNNPTTTPSTGAVSSAWSNIEKANVGVLYTDATTVDLNVTNGECTTLRWDFQGISSIYMVFGIGYDAVAVNGVDNHLICPSRTTTYKAIVSFTDGTTETFETTVNVLFDDSDDCGRDPVISQMSANINPVAVNQVFEVTWDAFCATEIYYKIEDGSEIPAGGQYTLTNQAITVDTQYTLRVKRWDGEFVEASIIVDIP